MKTENYVYVDKAVLQLVRNCLKRDAEEGKQSRKEILEELDKNTIALDSDPVLYIEIDCLYKTTCGGNTEFVSGNVHFSSGVILQAIIYKNPNGKIIYYTGYTYTNEEEFIDFANQTYVYRF